LGKCCKNEYEMREKSHKLERLSPNRKALLILSSDKYITAMQMC